MVTERPVVGVANATTPHSNRAAAAVGTGFCCQHIGTTREGLQAGDEVADGAVAVSPADEFTQIVRGGLNQVGHDRHLEWRKRRRCLDLQLLMV